MSLHQLHTEMLLVFKVYICHMSNQTHIKWRTFFKLQAHSHHSIQQLNLTLYTTSTLVSPSFANPLLILFVYLEKIHMPCASKLPVGVLWEFEVMWSLLREIQSW